MLVRNKWVGGYAYDICKRSDHLRSLVRLKKGIVNQYLQPANHIRQAGDEIIRALGDYASLHVRRGDKVLLRAKWPHLDADTRPGAILNNPKVQAKIPQGSKLFIATDERQRGFFDLLGTRYQVCSIVSNFTHILDKYDIDPVSYAMARLDYTVWAAGRPHLETFNDLTSDPKAGLPLV